MQARRLLLAELDAQFDEQVPASLGLRLGSGQFNRQHWVCVVVVDQVVAQFDEDRHALLALVLIFQPSPQGLFAPPRRRCG